ncbi:unnamed protein product, partial [Ectocarpus sp. 12 AP-2014]
GVHRTVVPAPRSKVIRVVRDAGRRAPTLQENEDAIHKVAAFGSQCGLRPAFQTRSVEGRAMRVKTTQDSQTEKNRVRPRAWEMGVRLLLHARCKIVHRCCDFFCKIVEVRRALR